MGSTLLAQQELLTPPPARRLIVPEGRAAHWGVDPSTKRVAIACVTSDTKRVASCSFPDLTGGARLAAIWNGTREFVISLLERGWPAPGLVWVEQPSGKTTNPQLSYAVGVIQAAVCDATACPLETIESSSWKKTACGRGNIYKPTRKQLGRTPAFADYGVAVWAQSNGYRGNSWDEADALGIAVAAQRTVALEAR